MDNVYIIIYIINNSGRSSSLIVPQDCVPLGGILILCRLLSKKYIYNIYTIAIIKNITYIIYTIAIIKNITYTMYAKVVIIIGIYNIFIIYNNNYH